MPPSAGLTQLQANDGRARDLGRQLAANGFGFGKLGHKCAADLLLSQFCRVNIGSCAAGDVAVVAQMWAWGTPLPSSKFP